MKSGTHFHLGVVGTGLMGRGIAQIAALAGLRVSLFDARPGGAAEARSALSATLEMLRDKGKLSEDAMAEALGRLEVSTTLAEFSPCDMVVEAIVEKLDAKRALFQELEGIVGPDCILATNTSSLSVTAIAAGCKRPERVAGLHFFSPVPLMKVVEVIEGALTTPGILDVLSDLARQMGHTPVHTRDTPGFIVNHAGRAYLTESLRILGEGIARFDEIDRILRDGAGFRMGPFELLDLTGLDVSLPVMESIYEQYYQEPRYRPTPLLRQRLAAGLLGRKTQRGFYAYTDGKKQEPAPAPVPSVPEVPVWTGSEELRALLGMLGCKVESGDAPSAQALCIVQPIGQDATCAALAEGLDPSRTIALDPLAAGKRRVLMSTPLTRPEMKAAAQALFARDGAAVSLIHDSPGFVVQRVQAAIVNLGCDLAQQRIATPEDIDRAVTLALGHPQGPLALGDAMGSRRVLQILEALHDFYQDPRYRPSPWLKRRALLDVSLLTPEA